LFVNSCNSINKQSYLPIAVEVVEVVIVEVIVAEVITVDGQVPIKAKPPSLLGAQVPSVNITESPQVP
jgi:hypothetical protein